MDPTILFCIKYVLIGFCCMVVMLRIQKAYGPVINDDIYMTLPFILIWPIFFIIGPIALIVVFAKFLVGNNQGKESS